MKRRKLVALVLATLLVGMTAAGLAWWRRGPDTEAARAVHLLPADTLRASWTDWAGVRRELGAEPGDSPTGADVDALVAQAFDRDLSGASTLAESASALQRHFGFSPATASWELYGQSEKGAVLELRLPDDVDFDRLADRLGGLGYQRPGQEDGVWEGGADLVPTIDPTLTPELQYVALLADRHLVLASDASGYLSGAVRAARGEGDHLTGSTDLVQAAGDPLAAVLFTGQFACADLAMSQADDADQRLAAQRVEEAGGVSPLTGLLVAVIPDRRARVVMDFETPAQATANARARATLASGEAVGKGGDWADRFRVDAASADGTLARLDLTGAPGQYVLSELTSGPVVFETC